MSVVAKHFTGDLIGRLESAEPRPNVVRSGSNYVVYIATADLLKLAERRRKQKSRSIVLAEKVKNGTPRQRDCGKNPEHLFSVSQRLSASLRLVSLAPRAT
jgi:hypothetical protein